MCCLLRFTEAGGVLTRALCQLSPSLLLSHFFFSTFFPPFFLSKPLSLLSTHTFKDLTFIIHPMHIN